ncbi:flavin monoamine oxidase family protein [Oryzihumus leptocrescens]|uniref:Monoamine oxidase n=1 Tax=Oryzihumus leptocrescens TaxID=297536 RepID=A0A542ZLU8_9MICO|nr:FAD-dependent oxidoreductase [Oryzihumus leptocrescens]TQL61336.1 monoamine oxidase [Oryzihumus leptocrescens]
MSAQVSRRAVLEAVGATGGAGILFEAMGLLGLAPTEATSRVAYRPPASADFSLSGRRRARVVVLGAGIAGLAAAYELGKAGYDCRVLEAKDRPGGRNWTVRGGTTERDLDGRTQTSAFAAGQYLNAGPARIAQWMVTLDYCRELGVAIEPMANQNADEVIYHQKGPLSGHPIAYRTAKADVYGYISELLAKATDRGSLDGELTATDKEKLLEFLRDFGDIGGREHGWRYTGSSRRGYRVNPGAGSQRGVVLTPPPSLHDVLGSDVGLDFSFELEYRQAMMMFQPVGGMDRIVDALTRRVGRHRVRFGCQVLSVTDRPDGVEVLFRDGEGGTRHETGDFCVAAMPPHLLARLRHNLGGEVQRALGLPRPLSVGKLGLEYGRRWWEEDEHIFGGITTTDMDVRQIWHPSHGFLGDRGVVLGYYNRDADSLLYDSLDPAARVRRAVAAGVRIYGEKYRDELVSSFSVAWRRTPFIEGGWISWPNGTEREYALLNKPAGRVYFAGDWLSHLVSWQAGAFLSARAAVMGIHERAMASQVS